ncbi:hypothetical protein [Dyadobacter sp. SG02]|uniref:hypothetical protein n=1 Tax=Dyadobacter sp. SG02 TaxID=1855291 RepID=UPI001C42FC8B|nr:hypothetical protein [Dyadobacter sp. SG02]
MTFDGVMGLLDLDKIIIKRTIVGIRCTLCGGNLIASDRKCHIARLAKIFSLGRLKPECYECETCKKRYTLL